MRRKLSREERDILDFLLTADFPGAGELRLQAPFASAVGRCPCGCATISLDVDRTQAPRAAVVDHAPVHASASSGPEGLLLFVDDGYLSGLEIYTTDHEAPSVFPPPSGFDPPTAQSA